MFINFTIRNRIFFSMLFLIFLSLVSMAFIIYKQFITTIERYNEERLFRKEQIILKTIDYELTEKNANKDNLVEILESKLYAVADINSVDINVYSLDGKQMMSTLGDNNIHLKQLPKSILDKLSVDTQRIELDSEEEQFDTTRIHSFNLVLDPRNQPIAIINIPYANKSAFLADAFNMIMIMVTVSLLFLLVGTGLLAWFISKSISDRIKSINQKIVATQLVSQNIPIDYKYNDELKPLVDSYNQMLDKLEVQTQLIATQEREDAWREMAKQVAHEIKNPLTPMKLLVQNFQHRFDANQPDIKEKVNSLSATLVQQIDTINEITEAFSDFAKMPKMDDNEIDLVQVTQNTIDLFSDVDIQFTHQPHDIILVMDNIYYSRIVTNLLKNAVQAAQPNIPIQIKVNLTQNDHQILLQITDNGVGIPKTIQEKIFEPKFTTKNSGSGLGLAMVKKIVLDYGGTINLQSEENHGTTFTVTFSND